MIRSLRLVTSIFGAALAFVAAANLASASDAKVIKKEGSGEAYFVRAGETAQIKILGTGSELIPEKATITTGSGVALFVETFSGAVATIRQDTTVEVKELSAANRKARLNLKAGQVISTLDPSKKNSTDYGIETPTGVAAARGTVFSVRFVPTSGGNGNMSVATLSGVVEIDRGPAGIVRVPVGTAAGNSGLAQALAAAVQSDSTIANDIVAAVAVVADNVASNTSAAGSADNAVTILAAVTQAAAAAVPVQASTIVNTAVQGAVAAGSATGASTLNAVSAITEAAVRAVANGNPEQIGAITQAATSAVAAPGATTAGNDAALNAALAAVTSAAVNAAPSQGAAAAQGAAQGVVNAKITDAVSAAKAANPNLTAEQLAQVAAQAAASSAATSAVSTIATAATTSVLASTGQSGNTVAASATALNISNAVNNGSTSGANAASATIGSGVHVNAPQVTVNVVQGGGGATVTSTATNGGTSAMSTQTVQGNNVSALTVQTTVQGVGTTTFTAVPVPAQAGQGTNSAILPPLDQNQPVISPSR